MLYNLTRKDFVEQVLGLDGAEHVVDVEQGVGVMVLLAPRLVVGTDSSECIYPFLITIPSICVLFHLPNNV